MVCGGGAVEPRYLFLAPCWVRGAVSESELCQTAGRNWSVLHPPGQLSPYGWWQVLAELGARLGVTPAGDRQSCPAHPAVGTPSHLPSLQDRSPRPEASASSWGGNAWRR